MRCGLFLPIFDELADPRLLADLAAEAEAAGWDGVFVWDHVLYRPPVEAVTDPWIALAAMAVATRRVLLGPMVTPLARRRPHIVARQVAGIDRLADGRFVLGVCLGLDTSGGELSRFGEETDDRHRAEMLDEGLALLRGLLSGEPVDHAGTHYTARDVTFRPTPTGGRVPVWVAARWPNRRPLDRAAAHDGLFIIDVDPHVLREAVVAISDRRIGAMDGYDVVVRSGDPRSAGAWRDAGATWWLAELDPFACTKSAAWTLIHQGPPVT